MANPRPPVSQSSKLPFLQNFRAQAFLLALTCFVFYFNTFRNGYAVDDQWVIIKNEAVCKGVKGIPEIFTSDIYASYYRQYNAENQLGGGRYRPLALVSYAIEQQLFGQTFDIADKEAVKDNAENTRLLMVRHLINVLLYILSVIFLLRFLRKTVFPSAPLLAFLSMLLFAIHPIHTEVVANIKSRDEILSLLFITLTLLNARNFSGFLYFFLALLSKEYAVSLIFLIPLMCYVFYNYSIIRSIRTMLPYLVVLIVYLVMRLSFIPLKTVQEDTEILNNPYLLATGMQKIATILATLLYYIKLLFFPHPLSVDYSYNEIPYKSFSNILPWLSLLVHAGLITAMVQYIKKRHVLAFAIAFYLLHLFLVSNLLFNIGAPLGERLIYHSSLGFCIAFAWFLYKSTQQIKSARPSKQTLVTITLFLVMMSAIKTIDRNGDWESNSSLYRADVMAARNSTITNGNTGLSYLEAAPLQDNEDARRAMLDKALHYFNKAISIHPGYTSAFINRGTAFFELGDWERAKQDWDTAKQQFPLHPDLPGLYASYYINTSVSKYGSKGLYAEAIAELQKGAALAPQNTIILFNLGYYYNAVGKKDSAIHSFQKIIDINPYDTLAPKCASYISILQKAP